MPNIRFNNVKSLRSWEACDAYFKKARPRVRSRNWDADECPLRDTRATHLSLVREDDGAYALKLYRTVMVRYFKPSAPGDYVVDINLPWNGQSNHGFLRNAGWGHGTRLGQVQLAVLPSSEPDSLSAHLVFRNNELRIGDDESWTLQFYKNVCGDAARQWIATAREKLEGIAMLMMLRIDQTNSVSSFYGATIDGAVRQHIFEYLRGETDLTEGAIAKMNMFAQHAWNARAENPDAKSLTQRELLDKMLNELKKSSSYPSEKKTLPMWWKVNERMPRSANYFTTRKEAAQWV